MRRHAYFDLNFVHWHVGPACYMRVTVHKCRRTFPWKFQISIQIKLYHLTKSPCVPLKKTPN